jgi:hypothetical protein
VDNRVQHELIARPLLLLIEVLFKFILQARRKLRRRA